MSTGERISPNNRNLSEIWGFKDSGFRYPDAGGASCLSCGPGTYSPGGVAACLACPAGAACAEAEAETYTVCPSGAYAPAGAAACTKCPAGRALADGATDLAAHDAFEKCAVCDAGKFAAAAGSATCESCAAGTFLEDDGGTGDALAHDAAADCAACPSGTASGVGSAACGVCPAGKFVEATGAAACVACAAGTYSATEAATACTACPAGTVGASEGAASLAACAACAEGTYAGGAGWTACADCLAGTHGAGSGNDHCAVCAAGKYSGARAAACTDCPAATYLEDAATDAGLHDDAAKCVACPGAGAELYCAGGGCGVCTDCELCTNENQKPTCPSTVDLGVVAENGGPAAVGSLGCADVDSDFLEYAITAGDDDGRFSAANNVLRVVADGGLDFEKRGTYELTVTATEKYTTEKYAATTTVTLSVGDVNDLALTAYSVEGRETLAVVGGDLITITGANVGPSLGRRRRRRSSRNVVFS